MSSGIEFTLTDGKKDWYDPVTNFYEENDEYVIEVNANTYRLKKSEVKNFKNYVVKEVAND